MPVPREFHVCIQPTLAPSLGALLERALRSAPDGLEEIRLRAGRPLQILFASGERWVSDDGTLTIRPEEGRAVEPEELEHTFQLMAQGSVYAWADDIRGGFLTLPGGHRVGLVGRAVTSSGKVETLRPVTGLNIRIARAVVGAARDLMPRLCIQGRPFSTLLISPPQAGKTTVLRDLVRSLSYGVAGVCAGQKVGVVDERSELGGSISGLPQMDLGPRTDVLDGCPKAEGIMILIRSMSPQIVAVDEIGRESDAIAVMEALHSGVRVIATAHGSSLSEVARRPGLRSLLESGAFERVAILSRARGPGTLEQVIEPTAAGGERLVG